MKFLKVNGKKKAVVYCQGGYRANRKVSSDELKGDCRQANADYPQGVLECTRGCVGLGSCKSVCKFDAIFINSYGVAEIDREQCTGCGICVKTCPQDLIQLVVLEHTIVPRCSNEDAGSLARKVCEVSCIACGICERVCPAGAVSVVDNCAVIDQELCIACGMCAVKCPRHVIVDADGIFSVTIHRADGEEN